MRSSHLYNRGTRVEVNIRDIWRAFHYGYQGIPPVLSSAVVEQVEMGWVARSFCWWISRHLAYEVARKYVCQLKINFKFLELIKLNANVSIQL
jgi:hypothetical protein